MKTSMMPLSTEPLYLVYGTQFIDDDDEVMTGTCPVLGIQQRIGGVFSDDQDKAYYNLLVLDNYEVRTLEQFYHEWKADNWVLVTELCEAKKVAEVTQEVTEGVKNMIKWKREAKQRKEKETCLKT